MQKRLENQAGRPAADRVVMCRAGVAVFALVILHFALGGRHALALEEFPLVWQSARLPGAAPKSVVETTAGVLVAAASRQTSGGATLVCCRSTDGGETWSRGGVIAVDPTPTTDLGDAALLCLRNGEILASYRHNHYRGLPAGQHDYSIRVARSGDGGLSWSPHSTVDSVSGISAGLWASYLVESSDGKLQCYYDDEATPWRENYRRHQWLTVRTWDGARNSWVRPVTVSRARDPRHLSRDGMCSVVETAPGRLLCVFESVDVVPPFRGVLRRVTSDDGGLTWSWAREDRPVVWRPADHTYNALAPWTIRLSSGTLLCVFVTDEDRPVPDVPSTSRLDEDVKAVYSHDDGKTWSPRPQTIAADHPCYLPGVVELKRGPRRGQVLLQYTSRRVPSIRYGTPAVRTD